MPIRNKKIVKNIIIIVEFKCLGYYDINAEYSLLIFVYQYI